MSSRLVLEGALAGAESAREHLRSARASVWRGTGAVAYEEARGHRAVEVARLIDDMRGLAALCTELGELARPPRLDAMVTR